MLKDSFFNITSKYNQSQDQIEILWTEIKQLYQVGGRFYHTIHHLENMLIELDFIKSDIQDFDIVFYALVYHDIIYQASSIENEIRSAELAEKRLKEIKFPDDKIELVKKLIEATAKHQYSESLDCNYFIDADLCILGANSDLYKEYAKQIRQEYIIYPDVLFFEGRKKVLKHFLEMKRIFKTEHFYSKFEVQARKNLKKELNFLN
jgi:predicted metal-dependent HD superfamily phosphohydrolase